jgi:hypothetical protein
VLLRCCLTRNRRAADATAAAPPNWLSSTWSNVHELKSPTPACTVSFTIIVLQQVSYFSGLLELKLW